MSQRLDLYRMCCRYRPRRYLEHVYVCVVVSTTRCMWPAMITSTIGDDNDNTTQHEAVFLVTMHTRTMAVSVRVIVPMAKHAFIIALCLLWSRASMLLSSPPFCVRMCHGRCCGQHRGYLCVCVYVCVVVVIFVVIVCVCVLSLSLSSPLWHRFTTNAKPKCGGGGGDSNDDDDNTHDKHKMVTTTIRAQGGGRFDNDDGTEWQP